MEGSGLYLNYENLEKKKKKTSNKAINYNWECKGNGSRSKQVQGKKTTLGTNNSLKISKHFN